MIGCSQSTVKAIHRVSLSPFDCIGALLRADELPTPIRTGAERYRIRVLPEKCEAFSDRKHEKTMC